MTMHILCIPSHSSHAPHIPAHTTLRCVCTGLQRWRLPDAWGHGLSILASPASPRTYYASLRMYGVTEMASSRRMGAWALYPSHPPHLPAHTTHPPHILRFAAYVRGYRDSVFQTHGGMGFLSSHPLHLPAHTTLRCVCTGLRRWRLPDA